MHRWRSDAYGGAGASAARKASRQMKISGARGGISWRWRHGDVGISEISVGANGVSKISIINVKANNQAWHGRRAASAMAAIGGGSRKYQQAWRGMAWRRRGVSGSGRHGMAAKWRRKYYSKQSVTA